MARGSSFAELKRTRSAASTKSAKASKANADTKLPKGAKLIHKAFVDIDGQKAVLRDPSIAIKAANAKSIEEAERIMAESQYETGIAYDKNGKVVAVTVGGRYELTWVGALSKLKGATLTHNHPDGTTFSIADVVNTVRQCGIKEFRAVAHNVHDDDKNTGSDRATYVMRPPKDSVFWKTSPAQLKADHRAFREAVLDRIAEKTGKDWRTHNGNTPIQVQRYIIDASMEMMNDKYNLGYRVITNI